MYFYLLIFCIFLISSLSEIFLIKRKKDILLIYYHLVMFIFLLAVLKGRGLGTDSDAYERYFLSIKEFNQNLGFEYLFSRLNEIVKLATNSYVLLLAIQAFVIYKSQAFVIKRWSVYPLTSLFYMWATNASYIFFVRQIVACFILFYSLVFVADRKFFKFLFLVVIAMGIHISSVIFLPVYFIWNWTPKKKTYIFLFIFFVFLFPIIFNKVLQTLLRQKFPLIIQQKIEIYFINPSQFANNVVSLIKGLINQCFLLFLLLLDFNKYKKEQKDFVGLFNIAWLGAVIFCSTIQIHIQIARFAYSYMLVYMLLLPVIMKVQCKKNKNTGGLFLIILLYYLGLRQMSFIFTVAPKEAFYFVDPSQKLGYK